MAATFIGGPVLQAISGYNPVYWYADSTEKARDGFRYLLTVEQYDPSNISFITLASLELPPRFGDGLMEINLAKILQSPLGFSPDSFDLNNTSTIWLNGQKSGYEYRVTLGEKYLYTWDWLAWGTQNGNLTLIDDATNPAPLYQPGDIIKVEGVTEEFEYTSITNDGGFARFNFTGTHTFQIGDDVNVKQDSPVSFLAYSVPSVVTNIGANYIQVNIPFAGTPYQTQTGKAFRNLRADAFHPVISVTVAGPFRLVELDFQNYNGFSAITTGTSSYADGRTVSSSTDLSGGAVWNGAVQHDEWPTFPFNEYWALVQPLENQRFLTDAPAGFCVRPENDMYLNFFTRANTIFERVRLVTQGPSGSNAGTYWYERDASNYLDWTTTALHLGSTFNEYAVQVLFNTLFLDGSTWQETEVLGAVGTFTALGFNYLDTAGGNGSVYLVQPDVLIPGNEYVVTIQVNNNNFVQILVGDENATTQILNNQNGTFSINFTATGNDFWIEMNSAGGVTQGVDITSIKAKTTVTDALNCDLDSFDVTLTREQLVDVIQNGDFATTDDWTITDQLGGVATIAGGVLNYLDVSGGNGTSLVVQEDALVPGGYYTVTITSTNTNFVQVFVGDEDNTYQIVNNANGTFTITFTATGNDFYIVINSAGGVTQGVDLDNVSVIQLQDQELSESREFSVCCDCDGRYENVELIFADRFGSILPFNFNLNHRRRLNDITRDTYRKQIGGYQQGQLFGKYQYSVAEHGDQSYATSLTQQWDINTGWLDEETSLFFEQVTTSAKCWARINGVWRAVLITDRVQDIKRKNNVKMIQYRLTIQFSVNDSVQGS